ncbi:MAG: AAA family ATPase [Ignavibacteriaceae bacterium]
MKIKKVIINNYRIFPSSEFVVDGINIPNGKDEGSGLTIFVGENGNGKTSLLEAISLPLLSYKAEGFSINDFNDPNIRTFIEIVSEKNFTVDGTMPKSAFQAKGFSFEAKIRERNNKAYLSSVVVTDQKFVRAEGQNKPKDGSPDLRVNVNNPFSGKRFNENDILYLDRNRTFQTRSGTYSPTRFDSLMEDFDYQYIKNQKPVQNLNQELDKKIVINIENKLLEKAAQKFSMMSGIDISLNYIDNWKPFSRGFFAESKSNNQQINLNMFGSGYEMMFAFIYSYYLSQQSGKQLIILIDEPELHLHPSLQSEFVEFLLEISKEVQIILISQSPLFVKQLLTNSKVKVFIVKTDTSDIPNLFSMDACALPYISANEINYLAFNLATEEYHNEIYGFLQEKCEYFYESEFEKFLTEEKGIKKSKKWARERNGQKYGNEYDVTLQTFIRNKIHHPENKTMQAYKYTPEELRESIDKMINILRNF